MKKFETKSVVGGPSTIQELLWEALQSDSSGQTTWEIKGIVSSLTVSGGTGTSSIRVFLQREMSKPLSARQEVMKKWQNGDLTFDEAKAELDKLPKRAVDEWQDRIVKVPLCSDCDHAIPRHDWTGCECKIDEEQRCPCLNTFGRQKLERAGQTTLFCKCDKPILPIGVSTCQRCNLPVSTEKLLIERKFV